MTYATSQQLLSAGVQGSACPAQNYCHPTVNGVCRESLQIKQPQSALRREHKISARGCLIDLTLDD